MEQMQVFELLGYVMYRDKDGQNKFLVTLATPCTEKDEQNNRVGLNVMKQYLPYSQFKNFNKDCIGKKYYLSTGFNGMGAVEVVGLIPADGVL